MLRRSLLQLSGTFYATNIKDCYQTDNGLYHELCLYMYMCFILFCINFALIRVGALLNYPVSRVGVYLRGRLIEALRYVN